MNRLKDYFHFQREEKIGFFFLLGIIVLVIVYMNVDAYFIKKKQQDFTEFEKKIEAFEAAIAKETSNKQISIKERDRPENKEKKYTLFPFDPNGLTIAKWMRLGLSEAQAEVIKNYEAKGGHFYDKEDVRKMYSISEKKYEELQPYIQIDQQQFQEKLSKKTSQWERDYLEEEEVLYLDLNIVDSLSLLKLSGIGPAFSSRILEYRRKIGGFHSKTQLLEIWGMDTLRYKKIEKSVYVDTNFTIRKIDVNSASADEMKTHPYISWNVANSIEKYREQNGKYQSLEDIKNSHLINDSLYKKLLPYLKLQ